jgi:hypothetical protein
MKKLIILFLMIALAGGAAFAQVTFNGQIEYETASSLDSKDDTAPLDQTGNYGRYDGDIRLQANIKADEYNTGFIRLRSRTNTNSSYGAFIDRAHATTDVGKLFDLPIGWKSQIGLNDWSFAPVGNAKWDTLHRIIQQPAVYNATPANYTAGNYTDYFFDSKIWGIKESFVFKDMVTLNAFFSLNGSSTANGGYADGSDKGYSKLRDFYIDGVFSQAAGPGKLGIEVAYMLWSNGSAQKVVTRDDPTKDKNVGFGDGTLLFALGYTGVKLQEDLSLDLGAAYYLPLNDKVSPAAYGVNAQVNIAKLAYVVVGLQGYPDANDEGNWGTKGDGDTSAEFGKYKGEILHNIRIGGGVSPVKYLSLDAGVIFYMGNDKILDKDAKETSRKTLNTLDVSAALKLDHMEYRLGYLYVPENDYTIDPFAGGDNNIELTTKSLYFKAKLAF